MREKIYISILIIAAGLSGYAWADGNDFNLKDLKGAKRELSEALKSGPVLVSFWATWCHPCREELDQLQVLQQEFSDSNICFFAVSIDAAKDRSLVKSLVQSKKYSFAVLLDPEQSAMRNFGLTDVPGLFILDRTGKIVYSHSGYQPGDEKEIRANISEVLALTVIPVVESDTTGTKAERDSL